MHKGFVIIKKVNPGSLFMSNQNIRSFYAALICKRHDILNIVVICGFYKVADLQLSLFSIWNKHLHVFFFCYLPCLQYRSLVAALILTELSYQVDTIQYICCRHSLYTEDESTESHKKF